MSIKFKIALLFAMLVTLLLVLVSIFVYFFSQEAQENIFETRLRNRALSTARIYAAIDKTNISILKKLDTAAVASLYNKSITIIGYDNKEVYLFSDNPRDSLHLDEKEIERAKIDNEYFFNYRHKKAIAIHHTDSDNNFIVAVAAADLDGEQHLQQLQKILGIAMLAGIFLSIVTGIAFASQLSRPIERIAGEVNLITSNNISQRIKVTDTKDELNQLALTFNNLLDRLQDSFAIQRRFISNASHELSTPLTSISSQLEVALQKKRTSEEYEETLQSVYEDIKELQQLTRSLLDIAKTGTQGSIDLTEVRLDEVLIKVASDVQRQNSAYKTILDFENFPEDENRISVFGNANLLYIALKNIVENGCKYSDNQESKINTSFTANEIIIKVINKGDVIAESDIQNIFQPFFRTSTAHSKAGFGLGLTLAKRILSLHKGNISVTSGFESGTIFAITIPNISSAV